MKKRSFQLLAARWHSGTIQSFACLVILFLSWGPDFAVISGGNLHEAWTEMMEFHLKIYMRNYSLGKINWKDSGFSNRNILKILLLEMVNDLWGWGSELGWGGETSGDSCSLWGPGSQLRGVWVEALTFGKIVQSLTKFYPNPSYLQNVLFLLLRLRTN